MTGEVLAANHGMLKLVRGFDFDGVASDQDAAISAHGATGVGIPYISKAGGDLH